MLLSQQLLEILLTLLLFYLFLLSTGLVKPRFISKVFSLFWGFITKQIWTQNWVRRQIYDHKYDLCPFRF